MNRTLVGVFDSTQEAQAAKQELVRLGIAEDVIHVRAGSAEDMQDTISGDDHKVGFWESLFGGLDDEKQAHVAQYSEANKRGHCVVVVDSVDDTRVEQATQVMTRHSAIDIDERAQSWRATGWTGEDSTTSTAPKTPTTVSTSTAATDEPARQQEATTRIPVVEEQIAVGKREIQRGGVRVYTRTVERPVEEQVTLREERAQVERHAVNRPATEADLSNAFKEGTIEVKETAEQPVVSKTAHVVEEVQVGKEVSERTETVRDTVRKTEVEVEDLHASRTKASPATDQPNTNR